MEKTDLTLVEKLGLLNERSMQETASFDEHEDDDEEAGYRAFVVTRQESRRAEMLEFLIKTGNSQSFAYSHLYRAEYDPSEGIKLQFSDHEIQISGRNLRIGYRRLLTQRVIRICEADTPTVKLARPGEAVVTGIEVNERE
ncbi:MAG: hypothetical protein KDB27_21790 [Planctomycetales bacterium]|nr:hypothetical protein [Planctomycetales bacterium]